MMENIVLDLFPQHEAIDLNEELELYDLDGVRARKLCKFKSKKASGIDGIPNNELKRALAEKPDIFCKEYTHIRWTHLATP